MFKYEEIIDYIQNEISSGNFTYKKRLPSIRTISELLNCSIGTVIKAYDKLEKNNIVYPSPKSGYYLLENFYNNNHSNNTTIDFSSGVPDIKSFPYKDFQHCLNKSIDLYKETLQYDKIISSLKNNNIRMLDTNMCFLGQNRNDHYFRISISNVDEEKIKKGIPLVINTIQKYISCK